MASEEKLIVTFETRIRQLILHYQQLQVENERLYATINEKETVIKDLTKRIESLKADYTNLKIAKMIEIGDDEMKNAKSRLSKLVRDVDKCIALLNV